jgi:hypothetical protein
VNDSNPFAFDQSESRPAGPRRVQVVGRVTCRHCGASPITAKPMREHGLGHWVVLLAAVAAGFILSPWLLPLAVLPVLVPSRFHVCPVCKLRID